MSCLHLWSAGIAEVHQCAQLSFFSFLETQADLCLSFLSTAIIGVGYYAYDRERLSLTGLIVSILLPPFPECGNFWHVPYLVTICVHTGSKVIINAF